MRREFSKAVKREALMRSGGLCEGWGTKVGLIGSTRCNVPFGVAVQYDHVDAINNDDVSLDNCQCLWLDSEAWKLIFLDALKRELRMVPNLDGTGFVQLGRSTSDLTKEEHSGLMELISAFGAQHGVTFRKETA